jgi:hypothetical protein
MNRIYLANASYDEETESVSFDALALVDGVGFRVAFCLVSDDSTELDFENDAPRRVVEAFPIANGLQLQRMILSALDDRFDESSETYADCFDDGDIIVLEHAPAV